MGEVGFYGVCEKYFAHRFDKIPTKEHLGVGVMATGEQGWVRPRCIRTQAAKRKEPAQPAFSSFRPDPVHGMALPKVSMGSPIVNLI